MTRRPRLMLLCTAGTIGGTERVVLSLARQFSARGAEVRTIFPESDMGDALIAWARDEGVAAETHPHLLPLASARSAGDILRLRSLVQSWKPDVVNLHYGGNHISIKDVVGVRLAGGARCIASVHLPTPWSESNASAKRMTQLASTLCHAIVVNSRATRDVLLEAGVGPSKIDVLPLGVPVADALPSRDDARSRLSLPPEAFVVGAVGRLVSLKGIHDLIEAVGTLTADTGPLALVITGDGPERASLEARAHQLLGDRVTFLGALTQTDDFYAALDVFALPSYNEGFGLVFVEAAFRGVPSIAGDVGGVPDAVQDGSTGILVPPGDVPAIAAAIARLRDDEPYRRALGDAAQARARSEFTEALMADRYADVYRLPQTGVSAVVGETTSPA